MRSPALRTAALVALVTLAGGCDDDDVVVLNPENRAPTIVTRPKSLATTRMSPRTMA